MVAFRLREAGLFIENLQESEVRIGKTAESPMGQYAGPEAGVPNLKRPYFRMVPDYSVAIEEFYPADPDVVLLGMASGTFTRDGNLNPENRWQTPIAIRASIDNGLVAEWRVYADNDPIRKLMSSGK